jgi:hypothetical protein
LKLLYWDAVERTDGVYSGYYLSDYGNHNLKILCQRLWLDFFKHPLDTLPNDWHKVYEELSPPSRR